ncbi:hypothetical protein EUTSA_v10028639mg [Eutrema salsugineum]|uniref:Uncharacterized protein n=1 Tax=Eutrema salsugineum TaxID=72664 RepID=V4MZU6_EUTSA|nr:uncharacterized protein LOC18014760 [Eutrema salsugineum]ESQ38201.1 hypothetical protein EUTSA_v10028639mg [Eutrema salsugineum]
MECCVTRRDSVVRGTVNEVKHTEEEEEDHGYGGNDCELDLLYLVHSDISSLLLQIDELVVKATKLKNMSKQGTREVETFRSVLSDVHTSLKPWFPRLQEALSGLQLLPKNQEEHSLMSTSSVRPSEEEELFEVESPEPTQFEPLVSPSPLVAWRGDYNADKGRQLFLLTPLPLGKSAFLKHQNASKMKSKMILPNAAANQRLEASKETSDGVLGEESMKTAGLGNSLDMDLSENLVECEPLSSPVLRRKIQSELLMTPCLKMSPPKPFALFKPVPESSQPEKQGACKSTCSELGASSTFNGSQSSGSSGIDKTDDLCSKFPELLGINHAPIARKTDIESSPVWWFSPPKTCVLLEPVNEKKQIDETGGSKTVSSFAFPNVKPEAEHPKEESVSMVVESTPMLKEAESVMTKNRTRAGESTLKKELWTRFEEASMHTNRLSSMTTTTTRGKKKKGFMEMLEEVCGSEES